MVRLVLYSGLRSLLVGTYVKGITITIIKGGKTGVIFWSKVYLSI